MLQLHDELTKRAKATMEAKNLDYATAEDPFRNFRRHGLLGMLVRMDDKMARLQSFIENGTLAVKDESVEDCLVDLVNYSVLFAGYIQDSNHTPATNQTELAQQFRGTPCARDYSFQDAPDEAVPIQRALFERLG